MSAAAVALGGFAPSTGNAVVELRREAASAVARQEQLQQELVAIRARAGEIEDRASRALGRGDDLVARQILARGLVTLQARDDLEAALAESRDRVCRLLTAMVRTENRAWHGVAAPRE